MSRNYQREHDELSEQYYQGGNPDRLSRAEFIRVHDAIWVDKDEDNGASEAEIDGLREDIQRRAQRAELRDAN